MDIPVIGRPDAPKGGAFTIGFPSYPKELLFYLGFESTSLAVDNLIFETLIDIHPDTYEPIPLVAKAWTVSKDKRVFTFKIDPRARFSDGKPVTAIDVKFTWDTIMNPKNRTAPYQTYFSSFETCRVIDPLTVEFKARSVHFKNIKKFANLFVLPKHFYSRGDFNKAFNKDALGSGPYRLDKLVTGERLILKRNPDYWAATLPQNIGRYNFDKITFKVVSDFNVQFEVFKKGDIDYYYFLSSKMWETETLGPQFKNHYLMKLKAENDLPYATQGIAWNLRRPLFQDRRVRLALSYLFDRERIIKEQLYNNPVPASGFVPTSSVFHSPDNPPVRYDPKKAKALLTEAGWKEGPDGVLVKDGKRFEFELVTDNPIYHRYLTVYQEDLKRMGIRMEIRTVDFATRMRLAGDWQFDATDVAQDREVEPSDFGVLVGSKAAKTKGSANVSGYSNPEVDELSEKIDSSFDRAERIKLVRKLDAIIGRDQPLTFAWEFHFFRIGYWNRYSFPGKGYFRYSTWHDAFQYWWYDVKKDEQLKKAMAEGRPVS